MSSAPSSPEEDILVVVLGIILGLGFVSFLFYFCCWLLRQGRQYNANVQQSFEYGAINFPSHDQADAMQQKDQLRSYYEKVMDIFTMQELQDALDNYDGSLLEFFKAYFRINGFTNPSRFYNWLVEDRDLSLVKPKENETTTTDQAIKNAYEKYKESLKSGNVAAAPPLLNLRNY